MPDPLPVIVQRMIDAGEPEANIAAVIRHASAAPKPEATPGLLDLAAETFPGGAAALRFAKDHPVGVGATLGGMAAAPFTGGLSAIPAMLADGGAMALGSTVGHGAKAAMTGQMPDAGDVGRDAAAYGLSGGLTAGALRIPAAALNVASMVPALRPFVTPLRLASKAIGGGARGQAAESAAPLLAAPERSAAVQAVSEAAPVTPPVRPTVAAMPPQPTRIAPAAVPEPPAPAGDVPMWGDHGASRVRRPSPQSREIPAMRRTFGAEDAGAKLGMDPSEVRALSGAPKTHPVVADNAALDREYLRRINDPRGSADIGTLLMLSGLMGGAASASPVARLFGGGK